MMNNLDFNSWINKFGLEKFLNEQQKGNKLRIYFSALALVIFLTIALIFPFKDKISLFFLKTLSHASSIDNQVEPEAGTLSGPVAIGSDSTASGGQYVQFEISVTPASTSPTPTITPTPAQGLISNLITDPNAVFTEPISTGKPAYLVPFVDSTFHTTITRIGGDPGTTFTLNGKSYTWAALAEQHYTNDEPWNADQSLIILQNLNLNGSSANPSTVMLDGNTYVPVGVTCSNYDVYDDRWHPNVAHKNERINVNGTNLEWFDVVNCVQTRHWTLPIVGSHDFAQNPTNDGRFAVVDSGTQMAVVDMDPQPPYQPYPYQRIGPVYTYNPGCPITSCTSGHISISPDGKYVLLHYEGDHEQIFDIDPNTLALTPHAETVSTSVCTGAVPSSSGGIYDLGHDNIVLKSDDNNQAYDVGQHRSWCNDGLGGFVGVRLSDGLVLPMNPGSNLASAYHASTMSYARPGWFYGSWWPCSSSRYCDEIDGFLTDGSGGTERLTYDHTDTSAGYRFESHPVPSWDGTRVIFESGWNLDCSGTSCGNSQSAQAYVIDFRASPTSSTPTPTPTPGVCPTLPTNTGVVTSSVTITTTGTYTVWSRIMSDSDASNSYWLLVDNNCGINVGDLNGMPTNTWTWVNYQNGTTTSPITMTLSAGSHTIILTGKEGLTKLDRVLFTTDTTCIPTGTGDNCLPAPTSTLTPTPPSTPTPTVIPTVTPAQDTTSPTVSISYPSNGSTITKNSTILIQASASDNVAVTKVLFYVNGVLKCTRTTISYSCPWKVPGAGNKSYVITATAYDAANNSASATSTVTTTK